MVGDWKNLCQPRPFWTILKLRWIQQLHLSGLGQGTSSPSVLTLAQAIGFLPAWHACHVRQAWRVEAQARIPVVVPGIGSTGG